MDRLEEIQLLILASPEIRRVTPTLPSWRTLTCRRYLSLRISEVASRKLITHTHVIGHAVLDLGPVVFRSQRSAFTLPVYRTDLSRSRAESEEPVGWLVLSLGQRCGVDELKQQALSAWASLSPLTSGDPSPEMVLSFVLGNIRSLALPREAKSSEPRVELAAVSPHGYECRSVSTLWRDAELVCSPRLVHLPLAMTGTIPALEVRLIVEEAVVAKSSVGVPFDWVKSGKPVDILLPLRDGKGGRAALLPLAMQLTPKAPEQTRQSELSPKSTSPAHQGKLEIVLGFSEPNISDPSWHFDLELNFECTLTVFMTGIETPLESRGRSTTSLLNSDPSSTTLCPLAFDMFTEDSVECALLTVVVRDAARPTCPEVCRGKAEIKSLIFSPSRKTLVLGAADPKTAKSRIFEKRNIAAYSCALTVTRQTPNGERPNSYFSDALASVHLRLTNVTTFRTLSVTSSIGKTKFKKSKGNELSAMVYIAGVKGILYFEGESKDSITYTGKPGNTLK